MYMYIIEFMVVLRNTVLDFVFRIILKSDCNSSKSPNRAGFNGIKVRDTYESVHALSICVNLILNDSDKRLTLY